MKDSGLVSETSVFKRTLTLRIARENFIALTGREGFKSYIVNTNSSARKRSSLIAVSPSLRFMPTSEHGFCTESMLDYKSLQS
jgi:hypothetical protein